MALIEIVSAPDMSNGVQAAAYAKKVQQLLRHVSPSFGDIAVLFVIHNFLRLGFAMATWKRAPSGWMSTYPCMKPASRWARDVKSKI
jgi:hypothetical protein